MPELALRMGMSSWMTFSEASMRLWLEASAVIKRLNCSASRLSTSFWRTRHTTLTKAFTKPRSSSSSGPAASSTKRRPPHIGTTRTTRPGPSSW